MASLIGWVKKKAQDVEHDIANVIHQPAPQQPAARPALPAQGQPGFGVVRPNTPVMHQPSPQQVQQQQHPSLIHRIGTAIDQVGKQTGLGIERTGVGIAQSASGIYDLAGQHMFHNAPSGATSRFDNVLNNAGKSLDQRSQNIGGPSQAAYKISQVSSNLGSFMAPAGIAKGVTQIPKVANAIEHAAPVINIASKAVKPLNTGVTKIATNLATHGPVGRITAASVKGGLSGTNLLNTAAGTAMTTGQMASHGQKVTGKDVALNAAQNIAMGAGLAIAPQVTKEIAPALVRGAKGVRTAVQDAHAKQGVVANYNATVRDLQNQKAALQNRVQNTSNFRGVNTTQGHIDAIDHQIAQTKANAPKLTIKDRVLAPTIKPINQGGYVANPFHTGNPIDPAARELHAAQGDKALTNSIANAADSTAARAEFGATPGTAKAGDIAQAKYGKATQSAASPLHQEALKYKSADEFVNSFEKRYHQTSPEAAASIEKNGFRVDNRTSGANDILPVGVNTKATTKDLGLGDNDTHLQVHFSKDANVPKFANRDQLENYFYGHKDGAKFRQAVNDSKNIDDTYQAKVDEINKRMDDRYKEIYSKGIKAKDDPQYQAINAEEDKAIEEWGNKVNEQKQIAQAESTRIAKQEGWDGVHMDQDVGSFGRTTDNTIILDPSKVKTKQQLTDIYNEAHAKATPTIPAQATKREIAELDRKIKAFGSDNTPAKQTLIDRRNKRQAELDGNTAPTKPSLMDKLHIKPINEGGYVRIPGGGRDPAPDLHPAQKEFINEYANMLESQGSGNGVSIMPDGTRASNNFRTAENKGKAMTKQNWFDQARQDIESGKAAYGASDEYNQLPSLSKRIQPATQPAKKSLPGASQKSSVSSDGSVAQTAKAADAPVKPLPEYGTKQVSGIDKAFRSTRSIIERQGEHGQKLAGMLQSARDTQEIYQAKLAKQLPTVRSLKGKDFENFVEATQGKVKANSPKVEQAIKEWQTVHPTIRDRAVKAGLDVGDLGPSYYPHFIDYQKIFKDKNTFNEALNHLVQTGQAKTPEDAMTLLNHVKDVSRNRSFGNLEAQRLVDLPMYDKTPNSLVSYLSSSAKRIAQTETFGAKDEKALKLITKAGQQGYDTEAMKNAYDVAVGAKKYSDSVWNNVSPKLRSFQSTTRLGLGALTNTSQNVNTGIVTGHIRTLGAMAKQLSPATRKFVEDTGVIGDAVLNDIKTQAGFTGKVLGKFTAPGFSKVESFNRSVAATAGRDYALRLAQKGDEATLRKIGVTGPIKNKTLTEAQQVQAARKVVEKTQFKVDPQDLPGWTDSPGGNLVAQFRTFSYSQGKFFSNEILKPAAHGNVLPLGRLLASLPIGYGLYETKRVINGRPEETDKKKVALQAFSNVGGAGLAVDIYNSLNPTNSQYLPTDRRVSMAAGTLGGPTVGLGVQATGAISDLIQRKNTPLDNSKLGGKVVVGNNGKTYTDATQAARFALNQIPIVGSPIRNRVLPYKAQSQAETGTTPVDQLAATKKKQSADLKNSLSAEDYKLSQLSKSDRQKLIDQGKYTQAKFDGLDNFVTNKKKQLGIDVPAPATKLSPEQQVAKSEQDYGKDKTVKDARDTMMKALPQGMNGYDVQTLQRFTGLPDAKKQDIFTKEPDAEYKLKLAEFERDKHLGTISDTELQSKQNDVFKAQVGAQFPKEVRDVYGMSKDKATAYLANNAQGNNLANAVIQYGDSLAQNSIENNKFVDNKGNVGIVPKGTVIEAKSGRISQTAQKNGIPDNIFAALVKQESGGNQGAKSPVGAIGLTQLMPATAKALGVDPNNADQNLDGGARYLKQMYDKFGRWDYALAAYNAGPGAVEKYHGIPPYTETQNYVKSILGMVNGGIKGDSLNLVINDPNAQSGGAFNQSGVNTTADTSASRKAAYATSLNAARATSGTNKLTKVRTSAAPNTKKGSTGYRKPALKQYNVAKTRVSLRQLAKLA